MNLYTRAVAGSASSAFGRKNLKLKKKKKKKKKKNREELLKELLISGSRVTCKASLRNPLANHIHKASSTMLVHRC